MGIGILIPAAVPHRFIRGSFLIFLLISFLRIRFNDPNCRLEPTPPPVGVDENEKANGRPFAILRRRRRSGRIGKTD